MITYESENRVFLGAAAFLLDANDRLTAWAEKHVRKDPDIRWVLGNFVQADAPNENGHIFPLEDLKASIVTIPNKPLNMLHRSHHVVGSFVGAELLEADTTREVAMGVNHPHVEALAAFWRNDFPEEYALVERAHKEGSLYFSMEACGESLTCPDCDQTFPYKGRQDASYCAELNAPRGLKKINKPHFNAGALIIPPINPGWRKASVNELSALIKENVEAAEKVYAQIEDEFPHLRPDQWEYLMARVLTHIKTEKVQ